MSKKMGRAAGMCRIPCALAMTEHLSEAAEQNSGLLTPAIERHANKESTKYTKKQLAGTLNSLGEYRRAMFEEIGTRPFKNV